MNGGADRLVVGVVGAGAMGSGIAQVAAAAGHRVVLGDLHADAVDRARKGIAKTLARDVEKGRMQEDDAAAVLARIVDAGDLTDGYAAYSGCGLIIEAVLEDLAVKSALFTALESVVHIDCVLASNTSSLSIAAIGGACQHAERVIGIHFFNPAPVMPLVEIVPAITTSADVVRQVRALVGAWKKTTVIASDTPGFIVNRIARPFYGESLRQLEEHVADIGTIDWAMRELGGFRMGPFELMDFIGNDVNYAVTASVYDSFFQDPRYRPALTQRRLVEAGLFGRKRGRGYYDYREGAQRPEPVKDPLLGQAIVDRTLAMLVNEAAEALHLRVASAQDIETSMTKGVNYPRGLLAWGDEIGAPVILERLEALQAEYGEDRYRPSPLLRRRVRDGQPLLPMIDSLAPQDTASAAANVSEMLRKDAFSRWLGVELVSLSPGACTLRMRVREEMLNGFGVSHGGIVFSLADSAMAFACNTGSQVTVAVDNTISFPSSVRADDELVAEAMQESSTNRLAFYRVTVRRGAEIVALFRGTVYRTAQQHQPQSQS